MRGRNLHTLLFILCIPGFLIAQQQVIGFTLVDAGTDQDIRPLSDNDIIDPLTDGTNLSIRADTDPALVGSVVFELDGSVVRTESVAPYALAGDNSDNYNAMGISAGDHTVTATPYSSPGGSGTAGTPLTISFNISDGSDPPDIPDDPVSAPSDPGTGEVTVTGELKQWHKVTLNIDGPDCDESDTDPNPFLDLRLEVVFTKGTLSYRIPGYFAADGDAANSGATGGNTWRVHFAPPETGAWDYMLSMRLGRNVAVMDEVNAGEPLAPVNGLTGSVNISASDKTGRDLRAHGFLEYVGGHYLRFAGTGEYFLKQGADSPENFLAYEDFDGNFKNDGISDNLIKDWVRHVIDWQAGDPTWAGEKGKGIIGAVNYLASEGMNAFSFLTMNINGDDKNVFPYTSYAERVHMDVSRLDQWEILFEHGTKKGMYLHFKTQETENETLLDGGDLGVQRRLYYRELIARFSHHPALNWNLGEEVNEQSLPQRQDMAEYFWTHDPYRHHIVIHNGIMPNDMLGNASYLTGFSLQTHQSDFSEVHDHVLEWVNKSADAGRPWVVACDEPGIASDGVVPDSEDPDHDTPRKNALWGTLMAGGGGNEWYFGYGYPHSDLTCNDFRSRDDWWDQCLIAMDFFREHLPFWTMKNHNSLSSGDYCFANPGEVYLVYLKNGGDRSLEVEEGDYDIFWFNPRTGGDLQQGGKTQISGPGIKTLGNPPSQITDDWAAIVRKQPGGDDDNEDIATLSLLTVCTGDLDPPFSPLDTVYSLELPAGTHSIILTAVPTNAYATVTGYGIIDIEDEPVTAIVRVISEDKTNMMTYRVNISFAKSILVQGEYHSGPEELFEAYPNPASDKVFLRNLEPGTEIFLLNTLGRIVSSAIADNEEAILDVSGMESGIYLIRAEKNGKNYLVPISIKR